MSVGTPVLAAHAGALPETVGEGGLLLDPDDAEPWATAIAELEDERTRLDLAARGRSRAASFSWTRAADETLRVYRLAAA
jgi:glycosyltransferase involved in cell wall biosynthesis